MPFRSQAQRRMFYATMPKMAETWERHTKNKALPEKIGEDKPRKTVSNRLSKGTKYNKK